MNLIHQMEKGANKRGLKFSQHSTDLFNAPSHNVAEVLKQRVPPVRRAVDVLAVENSLKLLHGLCKAGPR